MQSGRKCNHSNLRQINSTAQLPDLKLMQRLQIREMIKQSVTSEIWERNAKAMK